LEVILIDTVITVAHFDEIAAFDFPALGCSPLTGFAFSRTTGTFKLHMIDLVVTGRQISPPNQALELAINA
jgi:hypothetical protein